VKGNYCSRPFTDLHIEENGNVTPCCVMPSNRFFMGKGVKEYFYGEPLKTLKNQFLNNERPEECEYCWKAEEAGLKTHRRNIPYNNYFQIHLRLSNVCNFKCRMCNPKFSSTWSVENKKHNIYLEESDTHKDIFDSDPSLLPFLVKLIKDGGLKFLNISGGEPLITNTNYRLLSYLIDNEATNINIHYSTNLSSLSYNNVNFLDLWKNFQSVKLEVSCDGWGEGVEYSRTGFKRETFIKNLIKARKYVNSINCVVNMYSVWTLPQVDYIAKKMGIRIVYAPCFLPDFLNPQRLLREDKNYLKELYKDNPELINVYDSYIDKDLPILWRKLRWYNKTLDKYRGTDFLKTFPQFQKYEEL